jgi:hypothetical protein
MEHTRGKKKGDDMAATQHCFDAEGIVRNVKNADQTQGGKTILMLEVGNLMITCRIDYPPSRPPNIGERTRILGTWVRDENNRIYVDVHAMYAGQVVASE